MVFMKAYRIKQGNSSISLSKKSKRPRYDDTKNFSGDIIEKYMVMGFRHYETRNKNPYFSFWNRILPFVILKIIRTKAAGTVFIKTI